MGRKKKQPQLIDEEYLSLQAEYKKLSAWFEKYMAERKKLAEQQKLNKDNNKKGIGIKK